MINFRFSQTCIDVLINSKAALLLSAERLELSESLLITQTMQTSSRHVNHLRIIRLDQTCERRRNDFFCMKFIGNVQGGFCLAKGKLRSFSIFEVPARVFESNYTVWYAALRISSDGNVMDSTVLFVISATVLMLFVGKVLKWDIYLSRKSTSKLRHHTIFYFTCLM